MQTEDSPTSSFCQTKVEEGRRGKGPSESFHHSDLWAVWFQSPAACSRKELESVLSIKVAIVSIIWPIRSKNVLNEAWVCKMGVLHRANMMDNIRLEHELDWPLLLLRLLPPSHIFRLFLNMAVQVGSSPAPTDIFPVLLLRERDWEGMIQEMSASIQTRTPCLILKSIKKGFQALVEWLQLLSSSLKNNF